MIYFIAKSLDKKPYVWWQSIAFSIEELAEKEEFENPLVVAQDQIPQNAFGVCPLKIVAGELVERTEAEMLVFEEEFELRWSAFDKIPPITDINKSSFSYAGQNFPMDEVSRLFYSSMLETGGNHECVTTSGVKADLLEVDVPAFYKAFCIKLNELSKPSV